MPKQLMPSSRVFLLVALAATCHGGCRDDYDCSLAGSCRNGQCVCQSWVKGADCAALNLRPLKSKAELQATVQPAGNWSRWGGSVVDDGNGTHHMFAAEMAFECGLNVWTSKSQVLHAVSHTGPLGPFKRVGLAIPTEAHNPVLSRAADGTWLIWTCGCPHTPAEQDCDREKVVCPGGAQASWTTTVYSSKTLNGPWEPHINVLGNLTRGKLGSQNVSPIMQPDGSVLLMFKGPNNNTEASIASAPHFLGPYTMIQENVFAKFFNSGITNEDVYWWKAKDGVYHALSHRMKPSDREDHNSGGHAFTKNITVWHYALTPAYNNTLELETGSLYLNRRERPQILFSADGTPKVLYNGVSSPDSKIFTFGQLL